MIGWTPFDIFSVLVAPVEGALEWFQGVLNTVPFFHTVGAFGMAVIFTTLAIRTILFPIYAWQLRTTRRTQREQALVAPDIKRIRKEFKGQQQVEEMQKVYREHGISQFNGLQGCLPMFVQMPVIIGLYNGIRTAVQHLAGHSGFDPHFLWISDLSKTVNDALKGAGPFTGLIEHWPTLILPMLAALATFVQSRMMMPPARPDMSAQELQMLGISKNMSVFMPIIILVVGLNFPQGIAVYWVTQSTYMIIQQYYMLGWGGLRVPHWTPGAHRVTSLSHARPGAPAPPSPTDVITPKTKKLPTGADLNGSATAPGEKSGTISAQVAAQGTPARRPARSGNRRKKRR